MELLRFPRKQAMESGLLLYWPGKPCKNGHLTYRYTNNCKCRQCALDEIASERWGNVPDKELEIKKSLDDAVYKIKMKKLEKEYSYDFD